MRRGERDGPRATSRALGAESLLTCCERHFANQPQALCAVFEGSDRGITSLTYAELDQASGVLARSLLTTCAPGDRALLFFSPGVSFVVAIMACFRAGVIAVPCHGPEGRRGSHIERLSAIVRDCQPTVLLCDQGVARGERPLGGVERSLLPPVVGVAFDELARVALDRKHGGSKFDGAAQASTPGVALLQYTSGSIGTPKGVVVSHRNLSANLDQIRLAVRLPEAPTVVSWLPHFHDMGLVGSILTALYSGGKCILLSPAACMQQPLRWLDAVSRWKADLSGGPNFGYAACVAQLEPEDLRGLDLNTWKIAFNGAEPIQPEVMRRFAELCRPIGFQWEAFCPCYGLAEATLMVTGAGRGVSPVLRRFDPMALSTRQVKVVGAGGIELVGAGVPAPGVEVEIDVAEPRDAAIAVGEIIVRGPAVSCGYWPELDTAGSTPRTIRTGDLGFLLDDQLYVTGRLKDLIVVRGANYYPSDLEASAVAAHPWLLPDGALVFQQTDDLAGVVILVEVSPRTLKQFQQVSSVELAKIARCVRLRVADVHGLEVAQVGVVKRGGLPRTTSGKLQRTLARERFDTLAMLYCWRRPVSAPTANGRARADDGPAARTTEALSEYLRARLASMADIAPELVSLERPLSEYGLASVDVVALSGDLERFLDRPVSPTLFYGAKSPGDLIAQLTQAPVPAPVAPSADADLIAVVGMACRLPGATSRQQLWSLLTEKRDAVTLIPEDRWDAESLYDPELRRPGTMNTKWGGFISNVDRFDAEFFGISNFEAVQMDPQQRLALEVAWEALEDAGWVAAELRGHSAGVFFGVSGNDYGQLERQRPGGLGDASTLGNAVSIVANRISYFFDWCGPSLAVDTACSSSLVALHLACRSLREGECERALVGGTNLILSPDITSSFSRAGAMSPNGHCFAFDARANGIVRSEGVCTLALRPLAAAVAAGDRVYAVIRGSAVNQDGRSNGLPAPSPLAQRRLLQEACRAAGVSASAIEYVETHGTGTKLGDPIEAEAIGDVIGAAREPGQPCWLGTLKANLGHLEATAGVASVAKVALCLWHRRVPGNVHFRDPNPLIDFARLNLEVCTQAQPWRSSNPVAGVSAFGFGGTNGHVILQAHQGSAPAVVEPDSSFGPAVLPLSARTAEALQRLVQAWRTRIVGLPYAEVRRAAFTAACRRDHHAVRVAFPFEHVAGLVSRLDDWLANSRESNRKRHAPGRVRRPVFVFAGQGAQDSTEVSDLLARFYPAFGESLQGVREELARSAEVEGHASRATDEPPWSPSEPHYLLQLARFSLQVALARFWQSMGVHPVACVGHSAGEIAAAHICGALSLEQACRVICARARIQSRALQAGTETGAMALVRLSREELARAIETQGGGLGVAVHNAPTSCVVSGARVHVLEMVEALKRQRIGAKVMPAPGAGHSSLVKPLADMLEEELSGLAPAESEIPLWSTVEARVVAGSQLGGEYWRRNLRHEVRFAPVVEALARQEAPVFLEIGSAALISSIKQVIGAVGSSAVALGVVESGAGAFADSVAKLYESGANVDFEPLFRIEDRCLVDVPHYPWARQRHWPKPSSFPLARASSPASLRVVVPPFHPSLHVLELPRDPTWYSTDASGGPSMGHAGVLAAVAATLCVVERGRSQQGSIIQRLRLGLGRPGMSWQTLRLSLEAGDPEVLHFAAECLGPGEEVCLVAVGEAKSQGTEQPVDTAALWKDLQSVPGRTEGLKRLFERALAEGVQPAPPASAAWALEVVRPYAELVRVASSEALPDICNSALRVSWLDTDLAPVSRELVRSEDGRQRGGDRSPALSYLAGCVSEALRIPVSDVALDEPLPNLGIDSMTALELKQRIEREYALHLPIATLLDGTTLEGLASWLSGTTPMSGAGEMIAPIAAGHDLPSDTERVMTMAEDELDALLVGLLAEPDEAKTRAT